MIEVFNKLLGEEWAKLLAHFLLTDKFLNIKEVYTQKDCIPKTPFESFKIFRELQPKDIKVVILNQDPHNEDFTDKRRKTAPLEKSLLPNEDYIYDGYAFSCSKLIKAQPSLRNIIKEVEKEYPNNLNLDRLDLSYLVKQGVFLVNSSLTTILKKTCKTTGIHTPYWHYFTLEWIKQLSSNYPQIVWMLWGNNAIEFEQYVEDNQHLIIKTTHPSPLSYEKESKYKMFKDSGQFSECNNHLWVCKKEEIIW